MEWPRDTNKCVNFEQLVDPLIESARHLLKVEWDGKDVPYEGYPLGQAGSFDPDERLKAEQIRYDDEEQGRDPLNVMISLAVQVGIEQGRRIDRDREGARTEYEISEAIMKAAEEIGLDRVKATHLALEATTTYLRESQDLLTRIHFERREK